MIKSTWQKDALIGILITIIMFGLAEVGLRFYVQYIVKPVHGSGHDPWEISDPEMGFKLKPGYHNEERSIYINSHGFKGAEILEKTDGIYRIVALGDSTTFGLNTQDGNYPAILQTLLNLAKAEDCNLQFEVINAGVEGYNSGQIFLHFQRDVIPLEPDMILVYAGWNDIYERDPANPDNEVDKDSLFNRLLEYSFVLKAATRVVLDLVLPNFETMSEDRQRIYASYISSQLVNNYTKIVVLAQQHDISVVGLTLPSLLGAEDASEHEKLFHYPHYTGNRQLLTTLWRSHNRVILENLSRHNIPVIDLAQSIEAMSGESRYFFDTLHLYEDGYRVIAAIILDYLVKQNLLPCLMER
jgi:lysophospholipase L1-like esterase